MPSEFMMKVRDWKFVVAMRTVADLLYTISGWFVAASLGLMAGLVVLQVFSRNVYSLPVAWAGEVATYLMTWVVFVGSSMALREHNLIALDFLVERLPGVPKRLVNLSGNAILLVFILVCLFENATLVRLTMNQSTPILQWPMAYVTLALSVGFGLMTLYLMLRIIDNVAELRGVDG